MEVITKKEFKEMSSIHVYGRGERRRVALYFDWKSGDLKDGGYFAGFSHMIKGYGCTQKQILKDGYDILIKKIYDELCWYDSKTATGNSERFKVAISG